LAKGTDPRLAELAKRELADPQGPKEQVTLADDWAAYAKTVKLDQGAIDALTHPERATSLLPIGITGVEGSFLRGDVIRICSEEGKVIGYGMASCTAEKARSSMGQKGHKPVIHYDHLYIVP
jgi:glutamate 5-kinase